MGNKEISSQAGREPCSGSGVRQRAFASPPSGIPEGSGTMSRNVGSLSHCSYAACRGEEGFVGNASEICPTGAATDAARGRTDRRRLAEPSGKRDPCGGQARRGGSTLWMLLH